MVRVFPGVPENAAFIRATITGQRPADQSSFSTNSGSAVPSSSRTVAGSSPRTGRNTLRTPTLSSISPASGLRSALEPIISLGIWVCIGPAPKRSLRPRPASVRKGKLCCGSGQKVKGQKRAAGSDVQENVRVPDLTVHSHNALSCFQKPLHLPEDPQEENREKSFPASPPQLLLW